MKSLRWRLTLWFGVSLLVVVTGLILAAHWHLDYELRQEKWERTTPERPDWILHGSYSDKEVQDILGELVQFWVIVGVPLIGLALVSAYFIARRSDRPVREVNRQLAGLGPATLSQRVQAPDVDPEVGELVHHINDLLAPTELAGRRDRVLNARPCSRRRGCDRRPGWTSSPASRSLAGGRAVPTRFDQAAHARASRSASSTRPLELAVRRHRRNADPRPGGHRLRRRRRRHRPGASPAAGISARLATAERRRLLLLPQGGAPGRGRGQRPQGLGRGGEAALDAVRRGARGGRGASPRSWPSKVHPWGSPSALSCPPRATQPSERSSASTAAGSCRCSS